MKGNLKHRPLRSALRDVELRPLCLHCNLPINVRFQRQGYLHDKCEAESLKSPEEFDLQLPEAA